MHGAPVAALYWSPPHAGRRLTRPWTALAPMTLARLEWAWQTAIGPYDSPATIPPPTPALCFQREGWCKSGARAVSTKPWCCISHGRRLRSIVHGDSDMLQVTNRSWPVAVLLCPARRRTWPLSARRAGGPGWRWCPSPGPLATGRGRGEASSTAEAAQGIRAGIGGWKSWLADLLTAADGARPTLKTCGESSCLGAWARAWQRAFRSPWCAPWWYRSVYLRFSCAMISNWIFYA